MTQANNETNLDPYFFDREDLQAIADDATIRQGFSFYKENRVIEVDQDQVLLWGSVEDADSNTPYEPEIRLSEDEEFIYRCNCGANQVESVCRHVVAVLFAYADQCGESSEFLSAADTAIRDRSKRGRSEVQVEPTSGEPWFGVWWAASLTSTTHFQKSYRVTIRSLHRRANFCNCPDFAGNQLGTCKHIEAVLHAIRKAKNYKEFREQPAPFSYVYLAWDVDNAPQFRLHRSTVVQEKVQQFLDDYFDSAGCFTGRLPDDFLHQGGQ